MEKIQQLKEKMGTKRSVLADENGIPLAVVLSGANAHDVKLLGDTLDHVVVPWPEPDEEHPQNLCSDAGYAGSGAKVRHTLLSAAAAVRYANVWELASINDSNPKYSVSLVIPKSDTKTIAATEGVAKFGGKGIACGLSNIQKVRDGEPLSGRTSAAPLNKCDVERANPHKAD